MDALHMLMVAVGIFAAACAQHAQAHVTHEPAPADVQAQRPQPSPRTDQTVPVKQGMRLNINMFTGEVSVSVWNRDEVRVQAEHSVRDRVDVRTSETQVSVRTSSSMGPPASMDLKITVPAWMRIDVSGTYTDTVIDGVQGQINVDTVGGDITVKGGGEFVTLKTVEGVISLENAKGRVNVHSVNEGIKLAAVSGDVVAETINGTLTMQRMRADSVDAATVNGTISYEGTLSEGGQYRITSHNGDVNVTVPDNASATVSVRTYNGTFVPNFPVTQDNAGRRNQRFNFTLGGGSARMTLESFGGTIRMTKGARR